MTAPRPTKSPPVKMGEVPITLSSIALMISISMGVLTAFGLIHGKFILPTVLREASEAAARMDLEVIREHRTHVHEGAVTTKQFSEFVKARDALYRTIDERLTRIEVKVDTLLSKRPR